MPIMKVFDDTLGRGACRSCAAPIWWFELTSGKKHPFDAAPATKASGPIYLKTELDPETRRLIGHIDTAIHASHFATCPQARAWKGKGAS